MAVLNFHFKFFIVPVDQITADPAHEFFLFEWRLRTHGCPLESSGEQVEPGIIARICFSFGTKALNSPYATVQNL
jgi:hypothetical protein